MMATSAGAGGDAALERLGRGEVRLEGRIAWSSNATFLVAVDGQRAPLTAVYKPRDGERPLWDFPPGSLYLREAAAYILSHGLGWDLVPPTVVREGPLGPGAIQLFVHHDPERHFLTLAAPDPAVVGRIAAFDVVANNADRKSGHVLYDHAAGRLWCIDHGLTFHEQPKLRTVIWDLADEPLPQAIGADLERLATDLTTSGPIARRLEPLLSGNELAAAAQRAVDLVRRGRYPSFDRDRPAVPWPPV